MGCDYKTRCLLIGNHLEKGSSMTKPKFLTSEEVATKKNTTKRQIQRLAKAGVLPSTRGPRGVYLFKASDVQRLRSTSLV